MIFSKEVSSKIILLLLAAGLLMGLGRIATLPPFEGFDETAHYSRLEAVAFARPEVKPFFISTDVENYYRHGPMSPRWIFARAFNDAYRQALGTGGPMQVEAQLKTEKYADYHDFFSGPSPADEYIKRYREHPGSNAYMPSKTLNWQFQHPPLYYLLFGPVLRLAVDQPLIPRLLILRVLSYLIAFAGFAAGILATLRHLELRQHPAARDIILLGAFYPFIMPVYFEEFARLGNDSLCALLFGVTWALMLWHLRRPQEKFIWALLGVVMGIACLTKMTMVAASCGFLLFMALKRRPGATAGESRMKRLGQQLLPAAVAGAITLGISYSLQAKGGSIGSFELDAWLQGKGFITPDAGLPWGEIFLNLWHMLTSTVYNFGDLAMFNTGVAAITLMFLALMFIFIAWIVTAPRDPRREEWLPLYTLLPLMAGLFLHGVLAAVAYRADIVTPARYIHIEAPALALLFGAGLYRLMMRCEGRIFAGVLLLGAFILNAWIMSLRLAFFTGCVWVEDNFSRVNSDFGADACRPQAIYDRLALLATPGLGLPCLALAFALLLGATAMTSYFGARGAKP